MFIQRCLNVDATSWRCIDVEATLYERHVPAGINHNFKLSVVQVNGILYPIVIFCYTLITVSTDAPMLSVQSYK